MTVIPAPAWPPGNEQPKVLLHLLVQCSVDALWEDFFGSYPEIQVNASVLSRCNSTPPLLLVAHPGY
jgi:hypothetical protein